MKRVRYLDRVVDMELRSAASMRYGFSCRSYVRYLDRVVDMDIGSAASMRYGFSCRSYISTSNKKQTTDHGIHVQVKR